MKTKKSNVSMISEQETISALIPKPLNFSRNNGIVLNNLKKLRDGFSFDFDVFLKSKGMNLQRGYVWTQMQKEELIRSIIKGVYIPKISLVRHTPSVSSIEDVFYVIDGKQRLSTMFDFVDNLFPLTINGVNVFYSDLPKYVSSIINTYYPKFDVAYSYWDAPISDDEIISWFELINFSGTPQDSDHLAKLKS